MNAPTLFDQPHVGAVRHRDHETSVAAARRVGPSRKLYRKRIMELLRDEPLTDRELCLRIIPDEPLKWQSVISARSGLKFDHLVREADAPKRDGRTVWTVFPPVLKIEVTGDVL